MPAPLSGKTHQSRSEEVGAAIETVYSPISISRDLGAFLAGTRADLHRSAKIGWQLFRSDLRARRRKSVLGHLWLFVPALASAAICTLLQAKRLLALPATELPYPIFVLAGMLLWQTLSDAVQAPLQQLSSARQLITRTRIPHEAVVVAAGANVLLNAVARMLVLALVLAVFRVPVGPSALLVPIAFAALALLGLAVGLLVAPFGLLYDDVARAVPLALFVWLVVTPVLYPLPAQLRWLRFNPATPLIDAGRGWLLAPGIAPGFLAVLAAAGPALLLALLLYRVCRPHVVARLA